MKVGRALLLTAVCLAVSACYHQVVQTGRTPGTTVVAKPWTSTWVFGLIPAQPIDVSKECTSGIATVETQMTVPNWLGTLVTLGIWDPRDVKVTCATRGALNGSLKEFYVARGATPAEWQSALAAAADQSARDGQPVLIRF